mmetsp:Transcript_21611/g.46573  ORF Transcript_21611/g.46573 Transcript_21611/m.46573 type:complete len:288 (-) Transcript_21611:345-1208(-)
MIVSLAVAGGAIGLAILWDVLPFRLLQRSFPVPKPSASAVIVTGVSSGLGKEVAHHLAQQGYLVFGTVRKQADADNLAAGGAIQPVILDVSMPDHVPAAVALVTATLKEEGRELCGLVNNAGVLLTAGLTREVAFASPDHYEAVLGTNVVGVVRATEAFLPLLKTCPGARIVNVGSYFGELSLGVGYLGPYITSKFAIEGLTDVWRRALRKDNVAVALVKPGDFATDMNPKPGASKDLSPVKHAVGDALMSARPLARYHAGQVQGFPVSIMCRLLHLIPDRLADMLL